MSFLAAPVPKPHLGPICWGWELHRRHFLGVTLGVTPNVEDRPPLCL